MISLRLKMGTYLRVLLLLGLFSLSSCLNLLPLKERPLVRETRQEDENILKDLPILSSLPQREEPLSEVETFLEDLHVQKPLGPGHSDQEEFYPQELKKKNQVDFMDNLT